MRLLLGLVFVGACQGAESTMPERVHLGVVRAPSGTVVVLDAGMAYLWCHESFGAPERWRMDDKSRATAASAMDLRIEGPDAEEAGRRFDRQWHPRWLFDIPTAMVPGMRESFAAVIAPLRLKAELVARPRRVAHRERVDLAIAHGHGAGEIQYHGMWAAVFSGLPIDRDIAVVGERMPSDSPDAQRWRRVVLDIDPGATIATTTMAGHAMVDWSRLMIADADALGTWQHDEPLDGRYDLVFWGTDAAALAQRLKATALSDTQFGWRDLAHDAAAEASETLTKAKDTEGLKFAVDLRPHSHHWQLMQQVDASQSASGTVTIGDARLCGFMTSWGDGIFDILVARAANGRPVQVIIDCGNDSMVDRQRRFDEWWFGAFARLALVSKRVTEEHAPVGFLYREEPDREQDSGWRVTAGTEDQVYMDDPGHSVLIPLRDLIRDDRALEDLLRSPAGSAFARGPDGSFSPSEAPRDPDEPAGSDR